MSAPALPRTRHYWSRKAADDGGQRCFKCSVRRRPVMSAIRRGRQAVPDYEYQASEGGEWLRMSRVPRCVGGRASRSNRL